MKNKNEEFDWELIRKEMSGEVEDLDIVRNFGSLFEYVKDRTVPKSEYEKYAEEVDTSRIVAEDLHDELICLQKKLEKVLAWYEFNRNVPENVVAWGELADILRK